MDLEEDDGPHLVGAQGALDALHKRVLHQGGSLGAKLVEALRGGGQLALGDAVQAARLKGQEVEVFYVDSNLTSKLNGQAKVW